LFKNIFVSIVILINKKPFRIGRALVYNSIVFSHYKLIGIASPPCKLSLQQQQRILFEDFFNTLFDLFQETNVNKKVF